MIRTVLEPVSKWSGRLLILSFRCRVTARGPLHREGSGLLAVAGYSFITRRPLSRPARQATVTKSLPAVTPSEHHQQHLPTGSYDNSSPGLAALVAPPPGPFLRSAEIRLTDGAGPAHATALHHHALPEE
jgi:hypothetical protein